MYLQEILEVAIGLIFMWMIISIAVMQFNEWFFHKRRANELQKSIAQMLGNQELADKFYNHPLIASLSKKTKQKTSRLPSFISSNDFVTTLLDIIMKAGTDASPLMQAFASIQAEFDKIQNPEQKKLAKQDWVVIIKSLQMVANSQFSQETVDSLKGKLNLYINKYPDLKQAVDLLRPKLDHYIQALIEQQSPLALNQAKPSLTLQQLRLGLVAVDSVSPELTETLKSLLIGVEESIKEGEQVIARVRTNIETWYNNVMDRLIGIYKRKTQLTSFIIGVFLALLLNVDSITVATQMWREPTLRQAIIAQAKTLATDNPAGSSSTSTSNAGEEVTTPPTAVETIQDLQAKLEDLRLPFGWFGEPIPMTEAITACRPTNISVDTNQDKIPDALFGFKIGKTCYPITNASPLNGEYWLNWLIKLLGIAITGAAATQGAPFWFDLLKNVLKINVRSSGPKPEEK